MMTKTLALLALLILSSAPPAQIQTHDPQARTARRVGLAPQKKPAAPASSTVIEVRAGEDLQKALAGGGVIELQPGATFEAPRFTVSRSGTVIRGQGATIKGTSGPGLYIPPSVSEVTVSDLTVLSDDDQAVVQCGDNGSTQTAVAQQPSGIVFEKVTIPRHRGKRAFEINCAARLIESRALDVYSPAALDSQAIGVLNSCGPVTVSGGEYVAASENILVGGDVLKITDCPEKVMADLTFDGVTISKPDAWRTDGVRRANKNLFEIKAGKRIVLKNSTLSGSWKDGQDGWAILITPRNGAYIEDVLIDGITVDRAGGGVQFLGMNNGTSTPKATSGVVIRNSTFTISKAENGGRGVLALYVGGMLDSTWDNVTATFDGSAIVQADSKVPQGPFVMRNSRMNTGRLAVQAPGANFGSRAPEKYAERALTTVFEGNTFRGAPAAFRRLYPKNRFE
jgi:hypothetical protein